MKIRFPVGKACKLSLLLMLLVLSRYCSVLEDRGECPCLLEIDLSGCAGHGSTLFLEGWTEAGFAFGSQVLEEEFQTPFEVEVPRGKVSRCAYMGVDGMVSTGMALTVPRGCQADAILAEKVEVQTEGDNATDRVVLHKQYCDIVLTFKHMESLNVTDASMAVHGTWAGIDLPTLLPREGDFQCSPVMNEHGEWVVRVLRQGDDSLRLDVDFGRGASEEVKLGKIISEAGYDWHAEDLDNIWLEIDWTMGEIALRIENWKDGDVYTAII